MSEDNFDNEIKRAIGRVNIKQFLQKHEAAKSKQKQTRLTLFISAACVVAACLTFVTVNIISVNRFKDLGDSYFNSTTIYASRGGDNNSVAQIYQLIKEAKLDAALAKADDLLSVKLSATDDPAARYELFMQIDQTRWLKALTLMKLGDVSEAENVLRQIAATENSAYHDHANEILNR